MTDAIFKNKLLASSLIIILVLISDQATKYFIVGRDFDFTCNRGYAFGILPASLTSLGGQGHSNVLIVFLVLIFTFYLFKKETKFQARVGWALVLAGGLSNMIDRLFRGCVVDFIDIKIWPTFNLADSAISVGVAILIFSLLKSFKNHRIGQL